MRMTQSELDAMLKRNKGITVNYSDMAKKICDNYNPKHISLKPLISNPEAKEGHSSISFTIWGQPVGKPRMTQRDKWAKRPCVRRYWDWANKACEASGPYSLKGSRHLHFVAYLEIAKSHSKKKKIQMMGEPHLQKPDIDNLGKAIMDAIFEDDSKIWLFSGEKRWEDEKGPRMEVTLS